MKLLGILLALIGLGANVSAQNNVWPKTTLPVCTDDTFLASLAAYINLGSQPQAYNATLRFSNGGNDLLGDGSQFNPFKTDQKAMEVARRAGGYTDILGHVGERFYRNTQLNVDVPGMGFDAYTLPTDDPTAAKPQITCFTLIPVSAWIAVSGYAGTYSTAVSADVAWVRYAGDNTTVFRRMTSLSDCEATEGSWYWTGGVLYVHSLVAIDGGIINSGSRQLEYVPKNTLNGYFIGDYSCTFRNLVISGFGAGTPGDISYQGYGINANNLGDRRVVVSNCDVTYNGRHNITKASTGVGGSLVVIGCKIGWLVNDNINVVSYSSQGGQELVTAYNKFLGAQLPNTNKPYPYGGSGTANYAHTGGGSYTTAFFLSYKNEIVPGQYQNDGIDNDANPTPWTDLAQCRDFIVGCKFNARTPSALDATRPSSNGGCGLIYKGLGAPYNVYVGNDLTCRAAWGYTGYGDRSLLTSAGGVWINSNFVFDFSVYGGCANSSVRSLSSVGANVASFASSFYNCRLDFLVAGGNGIVGFSGPEIHPYGANRNTTAAYWRGVLTNSVITVTGLGSGQFYTGFANDGASMTNNAYPDGSIVSGNWGINLDPFRTISSPAPIPSSVTPYVLGYELKYDHDGRKRDSNYPSLGS